MAYCAQADILEQLEEDVLIQLTDDTGTGTVDSSAVTRAIADADAEIDGYCGTRYAMPFATVPGIVRKISVDVSIYNLYGRRSHNDIPSVRQTRYDNAVRFLRAVSDGKISLGADDPGGNPPAANAPQIATTNPERIFSRTNMAGF